MKNRVSKSFGTERRRGGFLLPVVSVFLLLAVFLPALSPAADTSEAEPPDSAKSVSQSKIDLKSPLSPSQQDDQKLDERQQSKRGLAPQPNGASYPIVRPESQRALRSIKRARSDFDSSMRNLNDSLRRANSAINRIRSLRKF